MTVTLARIHPGLAPGTTIVDRRRDLSLMRLLGMPHPVLRGIVIGETAGPLLSVLLCAVVGIIVT